MNIQEIFAKIKTGELSAHSELGTRDENKQSRNFGGGLTRLKLSTGIKAHAMPFKDVVLPFNPATGVADNIYNDKTPFRPILLVSQVLEGLKPMIAADPELQAVWQKRLGASAKIDWAGPVTHEDYLAFKHAGFIKPRVMSYFTVALNFGGLGGMPEFKTKYTVDPAQLNSTNSYDPETAPLHHKGAVFFNSMIKPEVDAAVALLEKQSATKDQIANQKSTLYSKSPIGFVNSTNLIPFLYFPIDAKPADMDPDRNSDFLKCIRFYGYNADKWAEAMEEIMKDDSLDELMDVFDFTISTPSAQTVKSNGQVYTDNDSMELYTAMKVTTTDSRRSVVNGNTTLSDGTSFKNAEIYAPVWEAAKNYFLYSQEQSAVEDGSGDTFEKLMAQSNRFRPIDTVMSKLLSACYEVFKAKFADSKYFTEQVKKANSEFFIAMNPDNALALADADDDELIEAAQEQAASVAALIADSTDTASDSSEMEFDLGDIG